MAKSLIAATEVTDREQVKALVERAEGELGPVETLVNCAEVMYYTLMRNLREDEWERTVEVNCKGAITCVGAVLPGMREGRSFQVSRSTRPASSSARRSHKGFAWRRPARGSR